MQAPWPPDDHRVAHVPPPEVPSPCVDRAGAAHDGERVLSPTRVALRDALRAYASVVPAVRVWRAQGGLLLGCDAYRALQGLVCPSARHAPRVVACRQKPPAGALGRGRHAARASRGGEARREHDCEREEGAVGEAEAGEGRRLEGTSPGCPAASQTLLGTISQLRRSWGGSISQPRFCL